MAETEAAVAGVNVSAVVTSELLRVTAPMRALKEATPVPVISNAA